MKEYNGHRSWNCWNVSLWLNNDDYLYTLAYDFKHNMPINKAVNRLIEYLPARTPDGAKYTKLAVKLAIADM